MSDTYTITLSTRDVPNPMYGIECMAGRCERVATMLTFGGSAAYCEQHATQRIAEPIPELRTAHVVSVGDDEYEAWTLADALALFSASIVSEPR